MKRVLLPVLLVVFAGASVWGQMAKAPIYKPPFPDAPKVRVDGRLRGPDDAVLTLTVLAPEHVGLTTKPQPKLYWYQSKAYRTHFELVITEAKSPQPLLEVRFARQERDGIQCLNLADHRVTLTPGLEYRWSVAMVTDEENRSSDVVASGGIKLVSAPESLRKRLVDASPSHLPFIYADEGFWYDSLEALCHLIDEQPTNKSLFEQRAVFFMQVGLNEAARHDLRQAGQTVSLPVAPVEAPKASQRK